MCLIIQTETPKNLNRDLLECAYENNSDGFGLMLFNQGKVHTHKIVPKTFADVEKMWNSYKDMDIPMALHFRFNTHGETNRAMSHPFQVLTKAEHGRDLWLMHNGPNLPTPMIDKGKSDTHQFIKWIIKPQLANNPHLLYNTEWQESLGEMIGTDKLCFLDGKTKEFTIINADEGKDVKGIGWLSNTYSITRGVGYNYDVANGRKALSQYPKYKTLYGNYGYEYDDFDDWDNSYNSKSYAQSTTDLAKPDDKDYDWFTVTDSMLVGASLEEIEELVFQNPQGIADYLYDICAVKPKK